MNDFERAVNPFKYEVLEEVRRHRPDVVGIEWDEVYFNYAKVEFRGCYKQGYWLLPDPRPQSARILGGRLVLEMELSDMERLAEVLS